MSEAVKADDDLNVEFSDIEIEGLPVKMFSYVDRRQFVGCYHCDTPICKLTDMEHSQPLVVEHMKVCPKHPMRELESRIKTLEAESQRLRQRCEELESFVEAFKRADLHCDLLGYLSGDYLAPHENIDGMGLALADELRELLKDSQK